MHSVRYVRNVRDVRVCVSVRVLGACIRVRLA